MGGKETAPVTMEEMLSLLFCVTDLQGNLGQCPGFRWDSQAYFTAFVLTQTKPCQFTSTSFVLCFLQIGTSVYNLRNEIAAAGMREHWRQCKNLYAPSFTSNFAQEDWVKVLELISPLQQK